MRDFITNARRAHEDAATRDPVENEDPEEPYDWREA
jgi:hypothetical protein